MKTFVSFGLLFSFGVFGIVGCASDVDEPQPEPVAEQHDALSIGGFNTSGGLNSWCMCKANCENDYAGNLWAIKVCKTKCETEPKCTTVSGGTGALR